MWCNNKCREGKCQWCDGTFEQLDEAINNYDNLLVANEKNVVYGILNDNTKNF